MTPPLFGRANASALVSRYRTRSPHSIVCPRAFSEAFRFRILNHSLTLAISETLPSTAMAAATYWRLSNHRRSEKCDSDPCKWTFDPVAISSVSRDAVATPHQLLFVSTIRSPSACHHINYMMIYQTTPLTAYTIQLDSAFAANASLFFRPTKTTSEWS